VGEVDQSGRPDVAAPPGGDANIEHDGRVVRRRWGSTVVETAAVVVGSSSDAIL
jgi:hypothetical protein